MMMRPFFALILLAFSGCATIDREIYLHIPEKSKGSDSSLVVFIEKPKSLRVFIQNQKDIKKPSYNGYLRGAAQHDLDNVIGRFSNPVTGDLQGVIRLGNNQSVQGQVQQLIALGLARKGYMVSESQSAPYKIKVGIEEFWGWNEDGEVTFELNSVIRCNIELVGHGETFNINVSGHGVSRAMIASADNWEDSYQLAAEDFINELEAALQVNNILSR